MSDDRLHYLSHSKLDLYKHSDRCFFWRYVRHIAPAASTSGDVSPMLWGNFVHAMLERVLSGLTVDEAMSSLRETGKLDPIDNLFEGGSWHTPERLHTVCSEWLRTWQESGDADRFDILDQELWIEHPILTDGDLNIRWQAVLDVVLQERDSGDIYIMDHKTTEKKVDSSYYSDQFLHSSQITAYDWLGHELFGEQYKGLFINAIQSSKRIEFTNKITSYLRDQWQRDAFLEGVELLGTEALTRAQQAEEHIAGGNMDAALRLFPHRDTYSENYCDYAVLNNTAPELREFVIETLFEPYGRNKQKTTD